MLANDAEQGYKSSIANHYPSICPFGALTSQVGPLKTKKSRSTRREIILKVNVNSIFRNDWLKPYGLVILLQGV